MANETSTVVKSGDILIEVTKFLTKSKSWQQRFAVLHRKTDKDHADICIYDSKDDFYSKKQKPSKKFTLENVKYIDKSTKHSKENKEYVLEFKCGKEKQILKFLTEDDLNNWESHLKDTVDICTDGTEERSSASVNEDYTSDSVFTENLMYNRTEQAISFEVTIDENDSAKRCHLKGSYSIHISSTCIGLLDTKKNVVYSWPYSYIRRYGLENQKNVFVVEVGRKCDSGEGQFRFQTRKAQEINDLCHRNFNEMKKSQNPMVAMAPIFAREVAKRNGSNVSEDSEGSPKSLNKHQSSVSSKDGTHNSFAGSNNNNNNNEGERLSATNVRKSGKRSLDIIPRGNVVDKSSGNGSEVNRQSVPLNPVSHGPSHVLPDFQKELEKKLKQDHKIADAKADNNTVQQIVDEPNDPKPNKNKIKKEERRESDKERKKKEGVKENSRKWSLFSKKVKENDRIKSSDRDSAKYDQKPQHRVPVASLRLYEEVDIPQQPVSNTYSEPFDHTKKQKNVPSTKKNNGKMSLPDAKQSQDLYSEPILLANPQNIYSEAVKPGESEDHVVYSEANKLRPDAWKHCGEAEQFHEEDYMNIQAAREMQRQTSNEPPLPQRPSDFDDNDRDDDDDDDDGENLYYNKLDFEKQKTDFKSGPDSHIYGTSSGPVGPLPEQNYESVSSEEEEEEEEEVQYAEADINPHDAYKEAKPKPSQSKPLHTKSQKSPPPESLYEDI